jgi:glyoxylate reductase
MPRSKTNTHHRVFVTRPVADIALRRLAEHARVDLWDDDAPPPHDELIIHIRDCDAVLSMVSDRLDAKTMGTASRLIAISNLAVGVDNIDLAAATHAGIAVGHTPGVLSETTADLAFALMLAAARRVAEGDRFVRAGRWRMWTPRLMLGRDVWGATLGVIGWGAIGQAVARRGAGFGMRVIYAAHKSSGSDKASAKASAKSVAAAKSKSPRATGKPAGGANASPIANAECVELSELLATADFISINVPLTPQTRQMIGARELATMKRGAILVNTARGPVIDQIALTEALRSGHLGGAGLDVTETEPIDSSDPLLKLANVVITPHIGSASHATRHRMAELAVDNILDVFAGRLPRHCANPAVKLDVHRGPASLEEKPARKSGAKSSRRGK